MALVYLPALHIVVTIVEYVCDYAPKMILKLPTQRLQVFHVKYENLSSLQLCKDQSILGKLKKRVHKHILAIYMPYNNI